MSPSPTCSAEPYRLALYSVSDRPARAIEGVLNMWTDHGRAEILVGIDGSAASMHAVDWALRIADDADRITLCCVIPSPLRPSAERRDEARRIIDLARSRAVRDNHYPAISSAIAYGHPAQSLRQHAEDMSLVVLGCPAAARAHRIIGESRSAQLLADMPCSVVIARPTAHAVGPVVVGVDDSAGAQAALRLGFELANSHHTELCAVHAASTADADELVDGVLDPWTEKYPAVPVRRRIRHGSVAHILARESRLASVMVVGASTVGGTPTIGPDLIALAGCTVGIAR